MDDLTPQAVMHVAKQWAHQQLEEHHSVRLENLPVPDEWTDFGKTLTELQGSDPEVCIEVLVDGRASLKKGQDISRRIRNALTEDGQDVIRRARIAVASLAPELRELGRGDIAADAFDTCRSALSDKEFYNRMNELRAAVTAVEESYRNVRDEIVTERRKVYEEAVETIGRSSLDGVDQAGMQQVVAPLKAFTKEVEASPFDPERPRLRAIQSDIEAVHARQAAVLERLVKQAEPEAPLVKFRPASLARGPLETSEHVEAYVDRLKERLEHLVRENKKILLE